MAILIYSNILLIPLNIFCPIWYGLGVTHGNLSWPHEWNVSQVPLWPIKKALFADVCMSDKYLPTHFKFIWLSYYCHRTKWVSHQISISHPKPQSVNVFVYFQVWTASCSAGASLRCVKVMSLSGMWPTWAPRATSSPSTSQETSSNRTTSSSLSSHSSPWLARLFPWRPSWQVES